MKMEDFVIKDFSLGINGNGRINEEISKIKSIEDFPLQKCKYLSMGGNGNGFNY